MKIIPSNKPFSNRLIINYLWLFFLNNASTVWFPLQKSIKDMNENSLFSKNRKICFTTNVSENQILFLEIGWTSNIPRWFIFTFWNQRIIWQHRGTHGLAFDVLLRPSKMSRGRRPRINETRSATSPDHVCCLFKVTWLFQ